MAVVYELAGLPARRGKASSIHRIIQAPFEQKQEILARDALHAGRTFEVVSELSFEDEVDALDLLLLAQLLAVTHEGLAAPQRVAMLSWWLGATFFNRTSGFVTSVAL